MIRQFIHRMKHLLHTEPCELLAVIHEPTCDGDCLLYLEQHRVCDHKLRLRCVICGEVMIA